MKYILFFVFCLVPFTVSANGMGTYAISATMRSSNPILRDIKDVTLLSEKLYIKLISGRSEITVKYILVNNSDKDYKNLDYAFPIDYVRGNSEYDVESYNDSNVYDVLGWNDSSVRDVEFRMNDKTLQYTISKDKFLEKERVTGFYDPVPIYRRWYYTQVDIEKHSIVSLEVRYSMETLYLCDGDNPCNIYYWGGCTGHYLTYDFSPARHWGDGIIRDFYVEVDVMDLSLAGDLDNNSGGYFQDEETNSYSYYSSPWIRGLNFERKGNRFEYRRRNFDLHKAGTLKIAYTTTEMSSSDIITRLGITADQYTIRTSSEQAKYPASNLSDLNLETAWVPANKGGIGDWVEFTFKKPMDNLAGFCILNGYYKNKETYSENNRIKKMKAEIKLLNGDWHEAYTWDYYKDEEYAPVFFENLFHYVKIVDFCDTPPGPVEKVRITILEVYPGTKYNDTCISEIIFLK